MMMPVDSDQGPGLLSVLIPKVKGKGDCLSDMLDGKRERVSTSRPPIIISVLLAYYSHKKSNRKGSWKETWVSFIMRTGEMPDGSLLWEISG
jgi:hypothetical protein